MAALPATLHHTASLASMLPREWRFDASSCAFVTDGAAIRVLSLHASEAARVDDAREQVEDLYRDLFELADHPVARAKKAVARAFEVPTDPKEAAQPARTVLAFFDAKPEAPSDRVAAYTRVVFDGERIVVSSVAVTFELPEDAQHQVMRAVTLATEELAAAMAQDEFKLQQKSEPIMVWRGQLGAPDYLKELYKREGFSTDLTDRLEMRVLLKHSGDWEKPIATPLVDGIEIRPLDLTRDDVFKVYNVLKDAFGPNPPSFEAWKRHYAQHPRFAADLTFVAWIGEQPVCVSALELVVDGEGGGEAEVEAVYNTDGKLSPELVAESFMKPLVFAEDYEQRKQKIRAAARVAYVCGIATLPEYRGKGVAQAVLRLNFQAAARAKLDSVYLGTDRQNPAAVRTYERAGMTVTRAENKGQLTAKFINAST